MKPNFYIINPKFIKWAVSNLNNLTAEEYLILVEHLTEKIIDKKVLSHAEMDLINIMPEFQQDEPISLVDLSDYVDDIELASAEYGYNIYDYNTTIESIKRRLDAGEEISLRESKRLSRLYNFDANNKEDINTRYINLKYINGDK